MAPLERFTVDPKDLTLDKNVRKTPDLDPAFLSSIELAGVITPILVRTDPAGGYLVVDGQRRTLAALEIGLSEVPVALIDHIDDEPERIMVQIAVNDLRKNVRLVETAGAVAQLVLMGVKPQTIQKRTGKTKKEVQAALALSKHASSEAVAEIPEFDIVQAAAAADFADDEDALKELRVGAKYGDFEHRLERLRVAREEAETIAREAAKYEEAGFRILAGNESWDNPDIQSLNLLAATAGGPSITEEEHADCPGRAVSIFVAYAGLRVNHYCAQWKTAGHYNRHATPGSGSTSGPQSDEEKAQRRHVIDMNAKAAAALAVHEQWLKDFFKRPLADLPKNLHLPGARLLEVLLDSNVTVWVNDARTFGFDTPTSPATAGRFLFALGTGAVLRKADRDYWRNSYLQAYMVPFLREISALGYPLADFEKDLLESAEESGK